MLGTIILSIIMLSVIDWRSIMIRTNLFIVIMLGVVRLSVIMLGTVRLSVIMLGFYDADS